jgi:hypothetical protein
LTKATRFGEGTGRACTAGPALLSETVSHSGKSIGLNAMTTITAITCAAV